MKTLKTIAFILLLINALLSKSQDFNYSQFYANKLQLNPAYASARSGTNIYFLSRLQWLAIPDNVTSFNSSHVGISQDFAGTKFGLGLLINRSTEGIANLTNTNISVPFAYTLPLQRKDNKVTTALSLGLQPSLNHVGIDWNKLIFSDQIDPVLENVIPTGAVRPDNTSRWYFDIGFGALLQFGSAKSGDYSLGFKVNHLVNEGASLLNINYNTPLLLNLHTDATLRLKKGFYLHPALQFIIQDPSKTKLQTFNIGFHLIKVPSTVASRQTTSKNYTNTFLGFYYHNRTPLPYETRHTNAYTFLIGIKNYTAGKRSMVFTLSYDMNASGLTNNNTLGTIEGSLVVRAERGLAYMFGLVGKDGKPLWNKKRQKSRQTKCSRWNRDAQM